MNNDFIGVTGGQVQPWSAVAIGYDNSYNYKTK